jgi:hypothetical protein
MHRRLWGFSGRTDSLPQDVQQLTDYYSQNSN